MRNKKQVTLLAVVVLVSAIVLFIIYAVSMVIAGVDDGYAQWGAADMVIDYMRDHEGEWPRNWTALEPYFAKSNGRVGGWSFERFKSHVYIDFDADANELRAASMKSESTRFDVIHATSIWGSAIGDGPNEMLRLYFRDPDPYGNAARAKITDKPSNSTEQ